MSSRLPDSVKCPECDKAVDLDPKERSTGKFKCPWCEKSIDLSSTISKERPEVSSSAIIKGYGIALYVLSGLIGLFSLYRIIDIYGNTDLVSSISFLFVMSFLFHLVKFAAITTVPFLLGRYFYRVSKNEEITRLNKELMVCTLVNGLAATSAIYATIQLIEYGILFAAYFMVVVSLVLIAAAILTFLKKVSPSYQLMFFGGIFTFPIGALAFAQGVRLKMYRSAKSKK